jgi:hypothetical protein
MEGYKMDKPEKTTRQELEKMLRNAPMYNALPRPWGVEIYYSEGNKERRTFVSINKNFYGMIFLEGRIEGKNLGEYKGKKNPRLERLFQYVINRWNHEQR